MADPKYSINAQPINILLGWIQAGEIAIPEIQRPFVWEPTKVRNLLDSLMQGFPVGYLITWRNPEIKLKDGSVSAGKRILIDGQQRMTALMAALLGEEVFNKDYERSRIRIAFHPLERRFEVPNLAVFKDPLWIPDIAPLFASKFETYEFVEEYCSKNPGIRPGEVHKSLDALLQIKGNTLGVIELESTLDIETVTEIFIRVNSQGVPLSQADFAMSKIAVNDKYDGGLLRKAIDYFCHLAALPDAFGAIEKGDKGFSDTHYFRKMSWLRKENDDLYDPTYTDMLRVVSASQLKRGRLVDLVALLSGRNFETKQFEESIVEDTFRRMHEGVESFINETHFKRFLMIIRSAGFINSSQISSKMSINFAYILYLNLRRDGLPDADIERIVRRWFVMSVLTGRYTSSPETTVDLDLRQITAYGIHKYSSIVIESELSNAFWDASLVLSLETSSINSPFFNTFCAAQVKMNDKGFLSRDITVRELVEYKSDVHHIFPKSLLKKAGLSKNQYNQIANYVIAQSEINIQIGNKEPHMYFGQVINQVNGGRPVYGNIRSADDLAENFAMNCIPEGVENMRIEDYPEFLRERRKLMARKLRRYFESL